MSNERVAVFTTFRSLPSGYGLVPVVLSQLKALVNNGYNPVFYAEENFGQHPDRKRLPKGVELRAIVPMMHLFDYQPGTKIQTYRVVGVGKHTGKGNQTNFYKQVDLQVRALEKELSQFDVIITHDTVFQTWFVVHNAAIREIARRHPSIRWIHWLHSGPSARPKDVKFPHSLRFTGMPNSVFVSPNKTMTKKFAAMYNIPITQTKVVYHIFDPVRFYDMHEWSQELIEKYNLYDCEALAVWATRVDHPEGKGMVKAIKLLGKLNTIGSSKLLMLNSWSNSPSAKANIKMLKNEAKKAGVPEGNLIFSSEMGPEWEKGVPWKVVKDMLQIGNMFIFPSISETFSFAMIEAAAAKNMLVLNSNLGVMTELCEDRAEYIAHDAEWGGEKITAHYQPDLDTYLTDLADKLMGRLGLVSYTCEHCNGDLGTFGAYKPLLQARHVLKTYTETAVWKNQMKPLITGEDWI